MRGGASRKPEGGAHHDHVATAKSLREALLEQLDILTKKSSDDLRAEPPDVQLSILKNMSSLLTTVRSLLHLGHCQISIVLSISRIRIDVLS